MPDYLEMARELIEDLALKVVILEPEDAEGWGGAVKLLDPLSRLFNDSGKEPLAEVAGEIQSIMQQLASGEHPEPAAGAKEIGDRITLLQQTLDNHENAQVRHEKTATPVSELEGPEGTVSKDEHEATSISAETVQEALAQDKELVEDFIIESLEHLSVIEVDVLSLEQDPENLEVLNAIFRPFHTIKGISGFLNLTDINRMAHEVEGLLHHAINLQLSVDEVVIDLILDAIDLMTAMINHLKHELDTGAAEEADLGLDTFLDRLRDLQIEKAGRDVEGKGQPVPLADGADTGSLLVQKGAVSSQDIEEALEKQSRSERRIGEILLEEKKATARDVVQALRDQKKIRDTSSLGPQQAASAAFVRVDTDKLDNMVDMVGELVITQAMLHEEVSGLVGQDKRLYGNLTQLRRITSEIQKISMSMRMVVIKQTFQKMIRLVRDLSKKSGKLVNLKMIGEDTEIDRNMVDEFYDPLVHVVRNCIDHGFETPEARKAMGKPAIGTLTLQAYHKGGNIIIEVSEDGRGLDREKIVRRAKALKLIDSADGLSDQEVFSLILHPGFSTAEEVNEVSGRGIGMNVVKRAVDRMRGKLEINSVKGEGTTMLMRLPLTLAIIEGLMVRAGDRDFIMPAISVVESIRPERPACNKVAGRGETIRIRDRLLPLVRLHSLFDFKPLHEDPWEAIVVVADCDGRRKCLLVDELVGKQEIVIKSLGERFKNTKGIAGGAILADGRVGLILDVPGLFELSEDGSRGVEESST